MEHDKEAIEYKSGNILADNADALINTVNCVGIMGRGIALQFKKAFPLNFKAYAAACAKKEVVPGRMFVYATGQLTAPRFIINFPTKRHWRGNSRLEDIESGLTDLVKVIGQYNIKSIAIPPLGSGLGGLDWQIVRARIEVALSGMHDVRVIVYEPKGAPESDRMAKSRDVPKMTPGRAALVGLVHRYLAGLLDPFVTLLEVQKLMYFLQEAGEELRLKYIKAAYGPYAENLRHVLNTVEGHYLSGYADGGDDPEKVLNLVPGAVDEANAFLSDHPETKQRLKQVAQLVDGFETPASMELLATVHWVIKKEFPTSQIDLVDKVHAWNDRKKNFTSRHIKIALDALTENGWVDPIIT